MEHHPSPARHDRIYSRLRQAGETAVGRGAVSADGLCGNADVAVFQQYSFQRQRIPAGQLQPDLQSLLPAPDHPLYQHDGQPYGFPDLGGGFHSAVFLVWDNPVMEDRLSPLLHSADGNLIPWRHLFHFVPEREIP